LANINTPDDGSNVGVELGHQDASGNDEDVQSQNVEEAEETRGEAMTEPPTDTQPLER